MNVKTNKIYLATPPVKWWSFISKQFYSFDRFVDLMFSLKMIVSKKNAYGFLRMHKKPDEALFNYKGINFKARKKDWLAVREVLIEDEYFFIEKIISADEDCYVLDLGGNIGCFALKVLAHNSMAKVVSVEASPATFTILAKNCKLNNNYTWKALEYAVWRDNETVYLECMDEPLSTHVLEKSGGIECQSIGLKTIIDEHCDAVPKLIKMDIEGAEMIVLPESMDVFKDVSYLIVEFHDNSSDVKKILDQLDGLYQYRIEFGSRLSKNRLYCFSRIELVL